MSEAIIRTEATRFNPQYVQIGKREACAIPGLPRSTFDRNRSVDPDFPKPISGGTGKPASALRTERRVRIQRPLDRAWTRSGGGLMNKVTDIRNTSTSSQQARLLARLKQGSATTFDLQKLNIMSPAARVHELKAKGHDIRTYHKNLVDHWGYKHINVAQYYLFEEGNIA